MPRKTIQKNLAYDTERQLYYAVFRQDGRRYTRTYRTREEAQAALEGNSCADRRLPGKDCTLGEWLTFWLEEVVARDRAESTLYAYRNMARCHVLPALGRIPLGELTPLRIQGYLYEKMNQGLSPNTVIKHYVMLTTALGMAVRLEMLERSPMDRVHTILPGIVLMDALTEALCEGELYISPYGVREGYLCHKLLNAGT